MWSYILVPVGYFQLRECYVFEKVFLIGIKGIVRGNVIEIKGKGWCDLWEGRGGNCYRGVHDGCHGCRRKGRLITCIGGVD